MRYLNPAFTKKVVCWACYAFLHTAAIAQIPATVDEEAAQTIADSYEWQLVRDGNEIQVFVRSIEGSNQKEFKGIMTIHAPLLPVSQLLNDPSRSHEYITTYEKVDKIGESTTDYHEHTFVSTPFFVANRDMVHHIRFRMGENSFIRTFNAVPDYLPEYPPRIRIPLMDGYWAGQAIDKNTTKITHIVRVSPGGNMSEGFNNAFLANASFKTMQNIKTLLENTSTITENTKPQKVKRTNAHAK